MSARSLRKATARRFAWVGACLALPIVACAADRPVCYAGEYAGCTCEPNTSGFTTGYAVCRPELGGYGACVCDGRTPGIDAGPASDASADTLEATVADGGSDGGALPLFAACSKDTDCSSTKCFTYGDGRKLCTNPCTVASQATDCPAPSPGCNAQQVCRPP